MLVDPGGGSDFEVDPAGLKGAAGQLGRAYDDMSTAITDYNGSACENPTAFGDFGMADAYSTFNLAWAAELSVTKDAIAELIKKIDTTADSYQTTDTNNAHTITSAGAR